MAFFGERAWMWLGQLLLLVALLAVSGPALARGPTRLIERCRIGAPSTMPLLDAIQSLESCHQAAAPSHYGTLWVSYSNVPARPDLKKTLRLAIDNHRVDRVDLWLVAGGRAVRHASYDPKAPSREWLAGNYFSILVNPVKGVDRIVLRLEGAQAHSYIRAPQIAGARQFAPIERNQAAIYGLGVGMLLITILFHLSLFFAIRRRFQLIYCIHVGLLFGYSLCYSGMIRIAVPGLNSTQVSLILGFTMAAATASGIAFIIEFMGSATPRWVRRWASAGVAASIAAALLVVLAPPALSYAAFVFANIAGVHAIGVTCVVLALACRRRHPMASAISLGWVLPITVSLMYPARSFGLIAPDMLPDGLMMMAMVVECLILSLPVTSRIRDLRIDHERAQERHIVLERQAQTDALTGLANRRGFGEALTRAQAAQSEPAPIAVMVIDIDHFKRVNDRHGHAAGDAILRHVASHVARVAGSGAIVARHGGEEFVVALRGHDLMRASTIAERIRCSIGITFETEQSLPPVTISIGVAAGFSDEIDTLLEDADCALYRAKDAGRDQVMLADGPLVYAAAA